MSQFNTTTSLIQDFRNLENVNQNNMALLSNKIYQLLNNLFPLQPCLAGASNNTFNIQSRFLLTSSTPTTATFGWNGVNLNLRFIDQAINSYPGCSGFTNNVQPIFVTKTLSNVTISLTSSLNNYVVATLNVTPNDAYSATPTYTIASSTEAVPSTANKLALFKLVVGTGGNLTVAVDDNCAFNYVNVYPDILNNLTTNTVEIIGSGGLNVSNGPLISNYAIGTTLNTLSNNIPGGGGGYEWNLFSIDVSTNHKGRLYTYAAPGAYGEAGIVTYAAGVEHSRLALRSNANATLQYAVEPSSLGPDDIVRGKNLIPGSSLTSTGHRKNPDGSITQWGTITVPNGGGSVAASFDIPFPNICLSTACSAHYTNNLSQIVPYIQGGYAVNAASNVTIVAECSGGLPGFTSVQIQYIAEGY